ncbi:MAG: DUF4136 domain-containing protein [Eudoraea sp.]|nr:DUF4136 domain-containing protein [Eudoraea sp.]MBT8322427.1 DUF4136 domain-containing protein [Eudoraea sp.]NNJ41259.1 DUF4136 domain-containing protein [Eudoraea sp.]
MKNAVLLIVFLLLVACGAVRVNYDYASETNFSRYTTYNYYPDLDTGLSELDSKRLLRAVDSVLQAKGIPMAENPDFFINIHSVSYRNNPNSTVGVGMGGTGRNVGGGVAVGIPLGNSNMSRDIIFDFVDVQTDALFWQAVSSSNFSDNASPSTRERLLRDVVLKVFSKYPPEK